MTNPDCSPEKMIAWNGMSVLVPAAWEVDSIEPSHLLIGQDNTQKIEIKWTQRLIKHSLEKYVRKFITQSQKLLGIKIHEEATPRHFIPENPSFNFFFFTWESKTASGNGVLLLCSHCRRLTIIRFFNTFRWKKASLMEAIIQSYTDHSETDICQWAVFGMKISIPDSFKLKTFQFKPGHYQIQLHDKRKRLSLYSWGPASFLLSSTSLENFAKQQIKLPPDGKILNDSNNSQSIQWEFRNPLFEKLNIPETISRLIGFTIFKITHTEKQNRITGILLDAPRTQAHNLMQKVAIESTSFQELS